MPPGLSTTTLLLLLCTRAAPTPAPDQYAAPDSLHRVPLYTAGVQPSEPLLPGAAEAFNTQKNDTVGRNNSSPPEQPKNILNFQGDDDLTIDQVKALDNALNPKEHAIKKRNTNLTSEVEGTSNDQQNRNKRDFIHWVGSSTSLRTEPAQHTIVHTYQISSVLPYYIPIWGNPRRIPIFFPPKPILFNPGYPVRNPPNNNNNGLLPIATDAPPIDGVVIGPRVGEEDDRPVWGTVESSEVTSGGSPAQNRPTKPPTPRLFHSPSNTNNVQQFTTTTVPVPIFRPTTRPFATTTRRPVVQQTRPPQSQNIPPAAQGGVNGADAPSRCIWAVISCCSPVSTNVRYACFEQLGCPGSFWDQNPCSREITAAALNVAQRFYQQNNAGS